MHEATLVEAAGSEISKAARQVSEDDGHKGHNCSAPNGRNAADGHNEVIFVGRIAIEGKIRNWQVWKYSVNVISSANPGISGAIHHLSQ